jgi:hypothetical protein
LIERWQGDLSVANANKGSGTICFPDANVFTRGRPLANPLTGNAKVSRGIQSTRFVETAIFRQRII